MKPSSPDTHPPEIQRLVRAIGGQAPPSFSALCDALGLPPGKTRARIERAIAHGVDVHVENNHVGLSYARGLYTDQVYRLRLAPPSGDEVVVGVISDTHVGSKYILRDALRDFVHKAYDQGVRHILHPGDVLDGMYRHGMWEVSHAGLEAQTRDAFETLPQLPGLHYHAICGNHDETFSKASGVNVGHYIEQAFLKGGRDDLHFYGDRGAFLEMFGTLVYLWHPPARKPHLMLAGHWHVFCHLFVRDVTAIACPTFQSGANAFGRSLGGSPAIGGLILRWQMTEQRTMRNFRVETCWYYDHEMVQVIEGAG